MSDSSYSGSAVKRSAGYFLIGKAVSALLTFAILLWLVRILKVPEYAAYITLVAGMEIILSISTMGLAWLEARYLPEFRIHASKAMLIRFIGQLIQCHLSVTILFSVSAWFCLDFFLERMAMSDYLEAAQLFIMMLVVEGTGRRFRDGLLGALLLQKMAQFSLVTRNLIFIIALGVLVYSNEVNLIHIIEAELLASSVGLLIAVISLWRYLTKLDEKSKNTDWIIPKWSQMWSVAKNMYFSGLLAQTYSTQVFTLIIRYSLGEEATAVFGFLRNLYMQILNYLPAALLFGLIRPKLVASYVGEGGINELTRNANIVGKMSFFVLMPLLVFGGLVGGELVSQLSGGKFTQTDYYFAGLLCSLIPLSQRQIIETVAVVTGNSHLCNFASLIGIVILPITYVLAQLNFHLWAPIIAIGFGHFIFCNTILRGVAKKTAYRTDYWGFYRMLLSGVLGYLASMLILSPGHGWIWIIEVATLASISFFLTAAIIKPFSESERLRINQLIKRNLFIW